MGIYLIELTGTTAQTDGVNTWYFRYDGDTPIGFKFNGTEYYYVTNLQGDIIAILDSNGTCVVEYEYEAWGNCTVTKDTHTIAYINPLRYRGYYYDSDTDLYYLQSRYYDANTGRFINADEPEMVLQELYNLFSYCVNDPVNFADYDGYLPMRAVIKPAPRENRRLLAAIKSSGLHKKRYATLKEYNGYTRRKGVYICTYRSSGKNYYYETVYYVYSKSRSGWLKYVDKYFGNQQAVSDFFDKLALHLGDPIFSTEPSVSNLASALSYASGFVSWALMPREASYILKELSKDKSNNRIVYIAKTAYIRLFIYGRENFLFGNYKWRLMFNKHVWAY